MRTYVGAKVLIEDHLEETNVVVHQGKITAIGGDVQGEVMDVAGLILAPSFIDVHVHMREPGFEHKATFISEAKACAKGGYTRVFAMPNTSPSPDDVDSYLAIKKRAEAGIIAIEIIASMSENSHGEITTDVLSLKEAGALAFSDDGRPIMDETVMEEALRKISEAGSILMVHEEDLSTFDVGAIHRGKISEALGIDGIPSVAEWGMIKRDAELAKGTGAHLHICHTSAKESLEIIREYKDQGVRITCEVAPHHLLFTDDLVLEKKGYAKVNPPLREEEDRLAMIEGLKSGVVDCIATDHAPHEKASKELDIDRASFGFSGIETAFSSLYTFLVKPGIISLERVLYLMSTAPARLMHLDQEGSIEVGKDENLVLIDLKRSKKLTEESLVSMGKNSPLLGETLEGAVVKTIYRGEVVYEKVN